MDRKKDYQISPIEMGISLVSLILGVGILTVPRGLANAVGTTDGWISILIAGIVTMFAIYLYTLLQQNYPKKTYLQYIAEGRAGNWGAKLIGLIILIYFLTLVSLQSRLLAMAVKMYLIDQTPAEVVVAIILLIITYAASKGVQGIVHIHLMFTPFIFLALFSVIIFNLGEADFGQLSPVMSEGIGPILEGVLAPMFSFVGIILLFFFMSHMEVSDYRPLSLNLFMLIIILTFTFLTITTYAIFGLEMTKVITFPSIELAKEIELIGAFIERLESLFLTVYIMAIFTTMANILLIIHEVVYEQFIGTQKHRSSIPAIILFVIFLVAFIPDSITELESLGKFLATFGVVLLIFLFLIGFLTVWLRKKRNNSSVEKSSQM
ncbi:hypothetical protein BTR23_09030 [Alkalihalophilus pseudofirmus]|nr:hypothetical protein BTR23_09030 [Alkalihalophilus pseudofirmus]